MSRRHVCLCPSSLFPPPPPLCGPNHPCALKGTARLLADASSGGRTHSETRSYGDREGGSRGARDFQLPERMAAVGITKGTAWLHPTEPGYTVRSRAVGSLLNVPVGEPGSVDVTCVCPASPSEASSGPWRRLPSSSLASCPQCSALLLLLPPPSLRKVPFFCRKCGRCSKSRLETPFPPFEKWTSRRVFLLQDASTPAATDVSARSLRS